MQHLNEPEAGIVADHRLDGHEHADCQSQIVKPVSGFRLFGLHFFEQIFFNLLFCRWSFHAVSLQRRKTNPQIATSVMKSTTVAILATQAGLEAQITDQAMTEANVASIPHVGGSKNNRRSFLSRLQFIFFLLCGAGFLKKPPDTVDFAEEGHHDEKTDSYDCFHVWFLSPSKARNNASDSQRASLDLLVLTA